MTMTVQNHGFISRGYSWLAWMVFPSRLKKLLHQHAARRQLIQLLDVQAHVEIQPIIFDRAQA